MTRKAILGAVVVTLLLATSGLAMIGSTAAATADDASTTAPSAASLAQDTTEEANETADEDEADETGDDANETEMTDDETEMAGTQTDNATAAITFEDQQLNDSSVVVAETNLSDGGFVAIFDADGELLGNSSYLESGEHENVTIELNASIEDEQVLIATPHMDTNGNETLDFNATQAEAVGPANATDGPFIENDVPVSDVAFVTPEGESSQRTTAALRTAP
jgi:hypothetical protein